MTVYDLPDVTVPVGVGVHAVTSFLTHDSSTFLCADSDTHSGRSYFSTSGYRAPAIPFPTGSLQIRIVGAVATGTGSAYFTVNNAPHHASVLVTDTIVTTIWSTAAVQPTLYLQGLFVTSFPFLAVPNLVLKTGFENFAPISDPTQGSLWGPIGPPYPPPMSFGMGAFYSDNADLKPNGKGRIKQTNA